MENPEIGMATNSTKPVRSHIQLLDSAIEFVLHGQPPLAVTEIGKLRLPADSPEASRCNEIGKIIENYAARKVSRPLSIAVFGPPGSGKSFSVVQIVEKAGCREPFIINLSQLSGPRELAESLKKRIQPQSDAVAGENRSRIGESAPPANVGVTLKETQKTPVFFFDEFDTSLNGESLAWLRWFLAPMQDGKFFLDGESIEVGKAVFMFAGGTAVSLREFEQHALEDANEYRDKKVPDFISRLCGYIDIEGINGLDEERPIRRALVLQRFLNERWPEQRQKGGSAFHVDRDMLKSLLSKVHFVHGVRSMQALLDMSILIEAKPPSFVQLPDNDLRKLHLSRGLLDGKIIGISAGQTDSMADSFLKELVDKLLHNGATLAYGGDFVPEGTLPMVVRAAARVPDELLERSDKRIRNYLAYPSFNRAPVREYIEKQSEADKKREDEKKEHVEFIKLNTLSRHEMDKFGLREDQWFSAREDETPSHYNPNHHLAWAVSLFRMRARLVQDIHALVVLGGKDDGKSWGRFSGIAEEVMLAFALGKPVYVLGGLGGGAQAVGKLLGLDQTIVNPDACLISGEIGNSLSSEIYAHYFTLPGHHKLPRTTEDVRTFLFERAITTTRWPKNGLRAEENRNLFCNLISGSSDHALSRMACVNLVISGLLRLDWKLAGRSAI